SRVPLVMECFDVSNISTTHVVASMVCFRNGVPDKDNYRRYRIRTVEGQDDFASMAEVVRRRYSRVLLEAREANPNAAEFSQESPAEAMDRINHPERSQGIPLRNVQVMPRDGKPGLTRSRCVMASTSLRSARNDGENFVAD